ncbi:MAG: DNA polymerase III subunit beta, partial [Elusimicrobiota bacterium]
VKALQEAAKIIRSQGTMNVPGDFLLEASRTQLGLKWGDTTLFSRLIEGSFPNWEQVIPKKGTVKVSFDKETLMAVTRRASLCIADRVGTCKYRFTKDSCEVTSRTLGHYEFEENVDVKAMEGAEGFEISFNPIYVMDFLKASENDTVDIHLTTSVNPALFSCSEGDSYRYVVMPTRNQAK